MAWAELQDTVSRVILAPLSRTTEFPPRKSDTCDFTPPIYSPSGRPFHQRTPSIREAAAWVALPLLALSLEIGIVMTLPTPGKYRNMAEQYLPALINNDPKK